MLRKHLNKYDKENHLKVLIIEDNEEIFNMIELTFKIRWPEAELVLAEQGEGGIELAEKENPDLIILDLGLPDIDGYEVLKTIRQYSKTPVIILTVRDEEQDIVKGLEIGADEYIIKPFKQLEFLSRIKAVLRRQQPQGGEVSLKVGNFKFTNSTRTIFIGSNKITLTHTEGLMLFELLNNTGKTVTYDHLANILWGEDYRGAKEAIRVYIRRLREKIEKDSKNPVYITNYKGIGYRFALTGA